MPAKSKAQQQAAGAALSVKEHERPKSSLKGASKSDLRPAVKRPLLNGLIGHLQKLPAKKVATALDQVLVARARGALAAMP